MIYTKPPQTNASETDAIETETEMVAAYYSSTRTLTEDEGRILMEASAAPAIKSPLLEEALESYRRMMSETLP